MKDPIFEDAHMPCTYCTGYNFGDGGQCYCSSLSAEQNTGQSPIETTNCFDGIQLWMPEYKHQESAPTLPTTPSLTPPTTTASKSRRSPKAKKIYKPKNNIRNVAKKPASFLETCYRKVTGKHMNKEFACYKGRKDYFFVVLVNAERQGKLHQLYPIYKAGLPAFQRKHTIKLIQKRPEELTLLRKLIQGTVKCFELYLQYEIKEAIKAYYGKPKYPQNLLESIRFITGLRSDMGLPHHE